MNQVQLDILNEIRVKMFYDPKKTLSEQTVPLTGALDLKSTEKTPISKEAQDFEQFKVYPIEGYKAFLTPAFGDPQGGVDYIYIPSESESSIVKYTPFVSWMWFKNGSEISKKYNLTEEDLKKILVPGTVRKFKIDGDTFGGILTYDDSKGLYFKGYVNANGEFYKTPNPEDFKSWGEKFMDKWGVVFQIVGSIAISIIIEKFTLGLGAPLSMRILAQVLGELAVNIPFSIYEIKQGEDITTSMGLALVFSLLPLTDFFPFMRVIKGANKEVAESIAEKASKAELKNADDVTKFYEDVLDEPEKYLFSQVMKTDPTEFKKIMEEGLNKLLTQGLTDKSILKKIALIDQKWWKGAGVQLSSAILLVLGVAFFGPDSFSEQEKQRMMSFLKDIESQMTDDEIKQHNLELIDNEEYAKSLINMGKTDSSQEFDDEFKRFEENIASRISFSPEIRATMRKKAEALRGKKQ